MRLANSCWATISGIFQSCEPAVFGFREHTSKRIGCRPLSIHLSRTGLEILTYRTGEAALAHEHEMSTTRA